MEKNNNKLEKLLKIKEELEASEKRIDSLENNSAYSENSLALIDKKPASYGDFLTLEDLQIINSKFSEDLNKSVECDALDYALSAASGVLCGLIDVIFVKTPHESLIGKTVDDLFDQSVIKLASPKKDGQNRSIESAIHYFEEKARVCYDQAKTQEITKQLSSGFNDTIYHLSTKNHHAKSLSHYPDIFGLISSICNQFTNTSTFLDGDKGRISIVNGTGNNIELQGNTLVAKIYCGFINWFLHCLSDVAGSQGSRSNGGIGTGLPIPFTEFFQFCNFGRFKNEKGQLQTFATVMTKVFEDGYDLRHGVATSVPVILNDLIIRAIYVIKQHYYNNQPWDVVLSKKSDPVLQRMMTTGDGSLCLLDLGEAVITSWGNWVVFFSHLNLSAWTKLGLQGIAEIRLLSDREMFNIEKMQNDISNEWKRLKHKSKLLLLSEDDIIDI